jgi:hypothetical protein
MAGVALLVRAASAFFVPRRSLIFIDFQGTFWYTDNIYFHSGLDPGQRRTRIMHHTKDAQSILSCFCGTRSPEPGCQANHSRKMSA